MTFIAEQRTYILDGHTPMPIENFRLWANWMAEARRRDLLQVAVAHLDEILVSTVFLGLDHRFSDDGPPLLFETMIFGGEHDQYQARCSTWDEAEAMHSAALRLLAGMPIQ